MEERSARIALTAITPTQIVKFDQHAVDSIAGVHRLLSLGSTLPAYSNRPAPLIDERHDCFRVCLTSSRQRRRHREEEHSSSKKSARSRSIPISPCHLRKLAALSAIMITGALILPETRCGMIDASITRSR
jgi:hypothetical protein